MRATSVGNCTGCSHSDSGVKDIKLLFFEVFFFLLFPFVLRHFSCRKLSRKKKFPSLYFSRACVCFFADIQLLKKIASLNLNAKQDHLNV